MEEIRIFTHPIFGEIRVIGTSEEPNFCATDVCRALGYTNGRKAIADHCDKGDVTKRDTPTASGTQTMTYVNESGLYSLIFSSKLECAKKFKKWVTSEVLPSIRKHGAYATPETIESIIANPDNGIKLLQALKDEREAKLLAQQEAKQQEQRAITAENEVIALNKEIQTMQPKINYYDLILQSKATVTVTQIAQDYGMSAKAFNILLRNFGIQRKVNGQWILYAPYIAMGYVQSESIDIVRSNGVHDTVMSSKWTQKGRLFLYGELKKHNVFPLIDINSK